MTRANTELETAVAVLESGTRREVLAYLSDLTPQQRKALGPKVRRWLTDGSSFRVPHDRESLAVIATADGVRQARLVAIHGWDLTEVFVEDAIEILAKRSPAWLPEFVESLLGEEGSGWNWRLARGLVRAQLVTAPDHPEYFRGAIGGFPDPPHAEDRRPLVEQLDRDPDLVGDHLLSMLSTEGSGRVLASYDSYVERDHDYEGLPEFSAFPAGTWRAALLELARNGRLDRDRLLDAVLAAPLRDWAAADLGWYVGMHDALEPTLDEVARRQSTYARLLTVEHGPSVKTAQRELLRLLPDKRFDPERFLAASRATLTRTDKASVAAHLRLLAKLAVVRPDLDVVPTVRIAGEHPRADVRDQAAKLLTRMGAEAVPTPQPLRFLAPAPQPRPAAPAVHPVGSTGELADVLLGLLEEIDPLQLERAIDGLLRFAGERPSTADLLLARADAAEYYTDDPRFAAQILILAWLTPRAGIREGEWPIVLGHTFYPSHAALPQTFVGAIGRRLTAVAQAVHRGPHTPVAMPTGSDFSLDADELNRRLRGAEATLGVLELELAVALLRVPVDQRSSVSVPPPWQSSTAIARILQPQPPQWIRRTTSPGDDTGSRQRGVLLFADAAGNEGDAVAGILARSAPERTARRESEYGEYTTGFEQTLAIGASLLPHDHETLAAHTHPYLQRDLRKDRATCVPVIDALAAARSPNGPPASSALVLALAAKDARARTAAQDALIDLSQYGVLDGEALGRQAALLLSEDVIVGQRVCSGLAECTRASDTAVLPILDTLQQVVSVLQGRRDAGAFLELAAELTARSGRKITLPVEFSELANSKSSSALARTGTVNFPV